MNPEMSVQPEWCRRLPIQQQSVLFLASRGPDGIPKTHPCKNIQRAYRGTIFVAARYGRVLKLGERADEFMSLDVIADWNRWNGVIADFMRTIDELPHHFVTHLMHGAEILGYHHPDDRFQIRWKALYFEIVDDMHLTREMPGEMDRRLSDWGREEWEQ